MVNKVKETIEIPYENGGDRSGEVRLEAGEEGLSKEGGDISWSMDVDKGKGSNRDQLGMSRSQLHHRGTRQAGQDSADPRTLRLNESGGEAAVVVSRGQGGKVGDRENFLEEDEVRLAVSDEGMEAPQVCPLVSIEADY